MKYSCLFVFLFLLNSCEYFNVKKTSSEEILQDELQTFSWNEVDEYPSFSVCDQSSTKPEKKICFEHTITTHITNYLANQILVVSRDLTDTITLTINISDKGEASIIDLLVKEGTSDELPELKQELFKSIDSLPEIFPAIKRGQQVTTQFKLPIIIQVN